MQKLNVLANMISVNMKQIFSNNVYFRCQIPFPGSERVDSVVDNDNESVKHWHGMNIMRKNKKRQFAGYALEKKKKFMLDYFLHAHFSH